MLVFKALKWAGKERDLLKELNQNSEQNKTLMERAFPPYRVVERKIGKSTFTVYSWFGNGKGKDAVSTIARLIQNDHGQPE